MLTAGSGWHQLVSGSARSTDRPLSRRIHPALPRSEDRLEPREVPCQTTLDCKAGRNVGSSYPEAKHILILMHDEPVRCHLFSNTDPGIQS